MYCLKLVSGTTPVQASRDTSRSVRQCYYYGVPPAVGSNTPTMYCVPSATNTFALQFVVSNLPMTAITPTCTDGTTFVTGLQYTVIPDPPSITRSGTSVPAMNSASSDSLSTGQFYIIQDDLISTAAVGGYINQIQVNFAVAPSSASLLMVAVVQQTSAGEYTVISQYSIPALQYITGVQTIAIPATAGLNVISGQSVAISFGKLIALSFHGMQTLYFPHDIYANIFYILRYMLSVICVIDGAADSLMSAAVDTGRLVTQCLSPAPIPAVGAPADMICTAATNPIAFSFSVSTIPTPGFSPTMSCNGPQYYNLAFQYQIVSMPAVGQITPPVTCTPGITGMAFQFQIYTGYPLALQGYHDAVSSQCMTSDWQWYAPQCKADPCNTYTNNLDCATCSSYGNGHQCGYCYDTLDPTKGTCYSLGSPSSQPSQRYRSDLTCPTTNWIYPGGSLTCSKDPCNVAPYNTSCTACMNAMPNTIPVGGKVTCGWCSTNDLTGDGSCYTAQTILPSGVSYGTPVYSTNIVGSETIAYSYVFIQEDTTSTTGYVNSLTLQFAAPPPTSTSVQVLVLEGTTNGAYTVLQSFTPIVATTAGEQTITLPAFALNVAPGQNVGLYFNGAVTLATDINRDVTKCIGTPMNAFVMGSSMNYIGANAYTNGQHLFIQNDVVTQNGFVSQISVNFAVAPNAYVALTVMVYQATTPAFIKFTLS